MSIEKELVELVDKKMIPLVYDRDGNRVATQAAHKGGVEDEPRDDHGKWTTGGAGTAAISSATPREFKAAFDKAFENSPFKNHVTHYTEEQLKGMKLFVSEGGKAGIAVHDHGDGRIEGTALFNQGGAKGAGKRLMEHAVKAAGINYLECYGEGLRKLYESAGFKVETSSPFNSEYAVSGWDYAEFGRPNYYTMRPK